MWEVCQPIRHRIFFMQWTCFVHNQSWYSPCLFRTTMSREKKVHLQWVLLNRCWMKVAQSCPTLWDPWTVAHQAPPSMGFSRQEYWSGLPFPSPGDLPYPGMASWVKMDGICAAVYCLGWKTFYDTLTSMSWIQSSQLLLMSPLCSLIWHSMTEQVANWYSSVMLPWGRASLVMTALSSGYQQRQTVSQRGDMPACHTNYSPAASSFAMVAHTL